MSQPLSSRAAIGRSQRLLVGALAAIAGYAGALAAILPAPVPAAAPMALVVQALANVPATPVVLAQPAPAVEIPDIVPLPKPAELMAAASTPGNPIPASEMTCLAEAVYYEARGESRDGQRAVAEVVAKRAKTRGFPKSICGVVYQDAHRAGSCQFSFACDGISHGRRDPAAWKRAVQVAEYEMAGAGRLENLTGSATYFHAQRVKPSWSKRFVRTVQIGNHIFYRPPGTVTADASS